MDKKDVKKYIVIVLLIFLAYISYLIIKPFITVLLASAILAYITHPLYKKTAILTKNKILAASLITLIIMVLTLFPLISIAKSLVTDSINLYQSGTIEKSIESTLQFIDKSEYNKIIKNILTKFTIFVQEKASKFLISIPSKIFHFLIAMYATFAFLLIGEDTIKKFKKMLPVKNKDEIIKNIGNTTYSIVYGLFATALLQFIIAFIAFKIIGASAALLLALIVGFLAFIPFLGPVVVWIPYTILEIIRNNTINVIILIILGVILFFIDTILKTKIISHHAKLHPVIILIGTIGGIQLMGFIGLVAGPVILSILTTIIESHYAEIKNEA